MNVLKSTRDERNKSMRVLLVLKHVVSHVLIHNTSCNGAAKVLCIGGSAGKRSNDWGRFRKQHIFHAECIEKECVVFLWHVRKDSCPGSCASLLIPRKFVALGNIHG